MIAAERDRWTLPAEPRGERAALARAVRAGDGKEELASVVAPLLVRLLAGEPLDREQRAVIVGVVVRLWALEAAAGR